MLLVPYDGPEPCCTRAPLTTPQQVPPFVVIARHDALTKIVRLVLLV